eukprot:COSAG06_NODE_24693_length_654_cov_1.059353_1_plen_27_part_01
MQHVYVSRTAFRNVPTVYQGTAAGAKG